MGDLQAYSVEIPEMGAFLLLIEGEDVRVISGTVSSMEYMIGKLGQPVTRLRKIEDAPRPLSWIRYDTGETVGNPFDLFDKHAKEPVLQKASG